MNRYDALQMAETFIKRFDADLIRANLVGSFVRKHPEVNDVDILVISKRKFYHGPPLNIFYTTEQDWSNAIMHWSIGKAIIQYKARAKALNYKLSVHGLYRGHKLVASDAREICKLLRKPFPSVADEVLDEGFGKLK